MPTCHYYLMTLQARWHPAEPSAGTVALLTVAAATKSLDTGREHDHELHADVGDEGEGLGSEAAYEGIRATFTPYETAWPRSDVSSLGVFRLCPVVCARSRAASGPAGHPRGVLCPSGVRPGLLRAVVKTPIRSNQRIREVHRLVGCSGFMRHGDITWTWRAAR